MPLAVGTSLGHYTITAPLGAGGMGEVYRAHDTKLDRDVAIKVLPETVAADKERLARFEREAKSLAALNHPNIATIHGFENEGDTHLLVMELASGEDLGERLSRGPIPVDEAIPLFVQIAEGLEAAHEKGIVHRDLKPANVMLGYDGRVKILDFGLAKAMARELSDSRGGVSQPSTLTAPGQGVIIGTVAYMSPEQASGRAIDERSDVWSFGVCLYEALCASRPFGGATTAATLAALLTDDPDWTALPESSPGAVRRLLRRCLTRDLRERLRHIADARLELLEKEVPEERGAEEGSRIGGASAESSITRLSLGLDLGRRLTAEAESFGTPVAISPDGLKIVWASVDPLGRGQLFLRHLDSFEVQPIAHTADATSPFFSPDSLSLGYFAHGRLRTVRLEGGPVTTLCAAPAFEGVGIDWGRDGFIYYAASALGSGLWRVHESGGTPERLTTPTSTERQHGWPQLLPDGRLLFSVWGGEDNGAALLNLETGARTRLVPGAIGARYLRSGHLVFAPFRNLNVLEAVAFDVERGNVQGRPTPVLDGVDAIPRASRSSFLASDDGTLVYVPLSPGRRSLVWVERDGRSSPALDQEAAFEAPRISPDGSRVAFIKHYQVWDVDLERGVETRHTKSAELALTPLWTPDGSELVYSAVREGPWNLFRKPADGTGAELILHSDDSFFPMSFSPDGTTLAAQWMSGEAGQTLALLEQGKRGKQIPIPFAEGEGHEEAAAFSPDGRFVAYVSSESGREQVYIKTCPEGDRRWTVSGDGGREPLWSPLGHELFYRNGDAVMAVEVDVVDGEPRVGAPVPLFEGPYESQLFRNYDISPDGQRFLMVQRDPADERREIRVVLNWFDEVRRLLS